MKYPDLPEKTLLRPDEVAEFLSVDPKTICNYFDMGLLEGTKPTGGLLRIFRKSVINFIEGGRSVETSSLPRQKQQRKVLSRGLK